MQIQVVSEVVSRLRASLAEARDEVSVREYGPVCGLVAFDGDGTLWSGDVGDDFFHAMVELGDIRDAAKGSLVEEALDTPPNS